MYCCSSDAAYPVEFVQLAGESSRLINCHIYGPEQPGDSSTWVVNRGFVTQTGVSGLLVRGNIFHSLRQPAYLNPGSVSIPKDGSWHGYMIWEETGFVWKDLEGVERLRWSPA